MSNTTQFPDHVKNSNVQDKRSKVISTITFQTLLFIAYQLSDNLEKIPKPIYEDDESIFSIHCLTHSLISTLENN